MNYIDFSQLDVWQKCPLAWAERYLRNMQKDWPAAQRDDAMALGSLVHAGLDIWHATGKIEIPQGVIEDVTPTAELVREAQRLLVGYAQRYGQENWEFEFCEKPLTFGIGVEGWLGLAKVDRYFWVDKFTPVESGIDGYEIMLGPGWWIDEKKTKGAGIGRDWYLKSWVNNMQASFQILAMRGMGYQPEGMLVSVLEKEDNYKPRRKCKECARTLEMSTYKKVAGGMWSCMVCGKVQELSEGKPREEKGPEYFRVKVARTEGRLEEDLEIIRNTALEMQAVMDGKHPEARRKNCVDIVMRRTCDYFEPHSADIWAEEMGQGWRHTEARKYMELEKLETIKEN